MDFQTLGQTLREAREARELTLEDAENALKIRRRILETFEAGEFNIAEISQIQVRGFIRNYAVYLGLDPALIIQMYDGALLERERGGSLFRRTQREPKNGTPKRETQPRPAVSINTPYTSEGINGAQPMPPASTTPPPTADPYRRERERRRAGFGVWLLRLVAVVALIGLAVFAVSEFLPRMDDLPTNEPDNIFGQLPPTFTPLPATPFESFSLLPTAAPAVGGSFDGQGVQVMIDVVQRTWMRLAVDGTEQVVGIVRPGTRLEYRADGQITLTATNAEAFDIVWNGRQQPTLGRRGQSVDVTFGRDAVDIRSSTSFEPTPIASDTPMPTPTDPAGALIAQITPEAGAPVTTDEPTPLPLPGMPATSEAQPLTAETLLFVPVNPEAAATTPAPVVQPTIATTPEPTMLPLPGLPTTVPTNTVPPTNTLPPTATETIAPSAMHTATLTLTPSVTPSATSSETPTRTPTITPSPTATPSETPTRTPTITPSPTLTLTPTNTATFTPSPVLPLRITPTNATPPKSRP